MSEPVAGPVVEHPSEEIVGESPAVEEVLLEEDLLIEDVSIDGMCGVY